MQAPLTDTLKPNTLRQRISRYAKWIVVITGVLWFARFAYLRITLRPTPRPEYWAGQIAALDPPGPEALTVTEAEKILMNEGWYPGASNSHYSYRAHDVDQLLNRKWDPSRADIVYYDPAFRSDKFETCRADVLRVAERGGAFHFVPGPVSGIENLLWGARSWAKTLVAHSRWVRETRGDIKVMVEDWRNALQLGQVLARPHVVATEQLRLHIEGWVAREALLAARETTASIPVREIADFIEQLRPTPYRAKDYLNGNRLLELSLLEYRFVRERGDWLDLSETVYYWPDPYNGTPVRPIRAWNLASFLFHDVDEARRRVEWEDDHISAISNCADREVELGNYDGPGFLDGKAPWELRMARYYVGLGYEVQTRLEAALASLALAEFHRNHGHYPESLGALVPTLLHHEPIDYADGNPLRYRRIESNGYVLYSIGANGTDDGGTIGARSQNYPDTFHSTNPDAVFSSVVRKDH